METAEQFLLNKVREINYKQPTPKQVESWMEEYAEIYYNQKPIGNRYTYAEVIDILDDADTIDDAKVNLYRLQKSKTAAQPSTEH